ncbi:unnamed protein product [Paramecium sonneborni]|uniref:Protein kinase domain-containing protein n=1 Tax=Paramecium sonneborni TaxID=65129 RepID=A0A8S1M201_9CILI|nr:unnamed protein product [Paramecium sonneborni]
MGNKQVMVNFDSPFVFLQDLEDQLQNKGSQNHPSLGSIRLWQFKKDPQLQLFSFVLSTSKLDSKMIQVHLFRCKIQHPNLFKYYACLNDSIIGGVEKQQYFFEYHPKTLNQQTILAPLKEENIWDIVEQIIDVMEYLQKLNLFLGNLSTEAILIDNKQKVKLLDNLGQQRLNKFSFQEDIIQLGLIILEMMTQRTSQLNFSKALKKLIGQYSLQLLQFTSKLLQTNAETRIDFIELKQIIKNRIKIPITNKQAQIIQTEQEYSKCSIELIVEQQEIEIIKQKQLQQQNQIQKINTLQQSQNKQMQKISLSQIPNQIFFPKNNSKKKDKIKNQLNKEKIIDLFQQIHKIEDFQEQIQAQKQNLNSSINSSRSTQLLFSPSQRISTSPNSSIQSPSNKFSKKQTRSSNNIHNI